MIPRTTRAQSMDELSSQANISGYKAVLFAANFYSRYFHKCMTAAGEHSSCKGVDLRLRSCRFQDTATARRLGAVVKVFDTSPAVKEDVMNLEAKFIEVKWQPMPVKPGDRQVSKRRSST